mgnify:CR=1 FL=1
MKTSYHGDSKPALFSERRGSKRAAPKLLGPVWSTQEQERAVHTQVKAISTRVGSIEISTGYLGPGLEHTGTGTCCTHPGKGKVYVDFPIYLYCMSKK